MIRANALGDISGARTRLLQSGADGELVALCLQCLNTDPAKRPHDAGEVARQLATWRASNEQRVRRAEIDLATAQANALGERRRRRIFVASAVAIVLVLSLGAGASIWQMMRATRAEQATASQLTLTQNAEAEARQQTALAELKEKEANAARIVALSAADQERQAKIREAARAESERLAKEMAESKRKEAESKSGIAEALNYFLQYKLLAQADINVQIKELYRGSGRISRSKVQSDRQGVT